MESPGNKQTATRNSRNFGASPRTSRRLQLNNCRSSPPEGLPLRAISSVKWASNFSSRRNSCRTVTTNAIPFCVYPLSRGNHTKRSKQEADMFDEEKQTTGAFQERRLMLKMLNKLNLFTSGNYLAVICTSVGRSTEMFVTALRIPSKGSMRAVKII